MALTILGHLFTGPLSVEHAAIRPNHRKAVFAILSKEGPAWDPSFRVIDVGYSDLGGLVFATHEKKAEWQRRCAGELCVYLLDMDEFAGYKEADRATIAEQIRARYQPPNDTVSIAP